MGRIFAGVAVSFLGLLGGSALAGAFFASSVEVIVDFCFIWLSTGLGALFDKAGRTLESVAGVEVNIGALALNCVPLNFGDDSPGRMTRPSSSPSNPIALRIPVPVASKVYRRPALIAKMSAPMAKI